MSTREDALIALETLLNTIKVVNGYAVDVKKVQRSQRDELLYENGYPAIKMVDTGVEEINRKTGYLADIYMVVPLVVHVRSRDNMSASMNAVDNAIKKAIASNLTLSGVVAHVTILPETNRDLSGDDDFASFTRPVRLFYEGSSTGGL